MSGKLKFRVEKPRTQIVEAVKGLLSFLGKPVNPLPEVFEIGDGAALVLAAKKDSYYTVIRGDCSCPSAIYNPGQPCKHRRKLFPVTEAPAAFDVEEELCPRGGFRPVFDPNEKVNILEAV